MPTPTFNELSPGQIRAAIKLGEQIDSLRQRLQSILGGKGSPVDTGSRTKAPVARTTKKRTMSPEGRERIAAAQRARWAQLKGKTSPKAAPSRTTAKAAPQKRGGITPEGRAKIAAAMKARWAARRKDAPGSNTLAP